MDRLDTGRRERRCGLAAAFVVSAMLMVTAGCAGPAQSGFQSPRPDIPNRDSYEQVDTSDSSLGTLPDQETHQENLASLKTAKRDLDAFRLFAKHLRRHGEMEDLALLNGAALEYVYGYVEPMIGGDSTTPNLETVRLTAVLMYLKAQLFYELDLMNEARRSVEELQRRYPEHLQNITVELDRLNITIAEGAESLEARIEDRTRTLRRLKEEGR